MSDNDDLGCGVKLFDAPQPETFVPLNDLKPRGFLPWRRSRIYQMVEAGTLPEPVRFGPKLVGYTLTQIADIQRRLMVLR